jgi:hypothetical protein
MEEGDKTKKLAPPYISWKTLIGFIKSFDQGLPPRIDKSAMSRISGGNQNLLINALTYLKLIKADQSPEILLENIVDSLSLAEKTEYQDHLRMMLKKAYPFLFDGSANFDLARSTAAHFDEKFRAEGVSGETVGKCEAFFISAAQEAEIPISRLILEAKRKGPKRPSFGGSPKPKANKSDAKQRETPPPADPEPPRQELSGWFVTYKPAFDLLPKFSTNPRPKWTAQDEENFLNLVKALTTAYIEREDKKKA